MAGQSKISTKHTPEALRSRKDVERRLEQFIVSLRKLPMVRTHKTFVTSKPAHQLASNIFDLLRPQTRTLLKKQQLGYKDLLKVNWIDTKDPGVYYAMGYKKDEDGNIWGVVLYIGCAWGMRGGLSWRRISHEQSHSNCSFSKVLEEAKKDGTEWSWGVLAIGKAFRRILPEDDLKTSIYYLCESILSLWLGAVSANASKPYQKLVPEGLYQWSGLVTHNALDDPVASQPREKSDDDEIAAASKRRESHRLSRVHRKEDLKTRANAGEEEAIAEVEKSKEMGRINVAKYRRTTGDKKKRMRALAKAGDGDAQKYVADLNKKKLAAYHQSKSLPTKRPHLRDKSMRALAKAGDSAAQAYMAKVKKQKSESYHRCKKSSVKK